MVYLEIFSLNTLHNSQIIRRSSQMLHAGENQLHAIKKTNANLRSASAFANYIYDLQIDVEAPLLRVNRVNSPPFQNAM